MVSPTNCSHYLRAVPKTFIDCICLFRFVMGPNNCGVFFTYIAQQNRTQVLRLLDRVSFRIGVSKNSKGWGTLFILGALLGYTKTTTEHNVLLTQLTCTSEIRLHRFKTRKAALTYTSDSEIATHSQGWDFIPSFLTRTVERFMNGKVRRKVRTYIWTFQTLLTILCWEFHTP